jgi:3-oxoacyl-[acyl-carrier-protein] synthase-3
MALAHINSVVIRGLAGCVPRTVARTADYSGLTFEDRVKFAKTTGIEERRVSAPDQCASDFCAAAANRLLKELLWSRDEVKLLVCVTQSPDYPVPATAVILQQRLGLSTGCVAFDVNMGCSGYVYGLSIIASLLAAIGQGKALLLVGDTSTKSAHPRDRTTAPLFGDAGTATALEYAPEAPMMHFDLNSDGRGWESIVMRHGGFRQPIAADSLLVREVEPGVWRAACNLELNGVDVFNFGLREAPKTVAALLQALSGKVEDPDLFVFHQANLLMNEMIRKKLNIPEAKCPYSLRRFGNTSCASIPLTLVNNCAGLLRVGSRKLVLCGFGVGLSWASAWVETRDLVCPDLVEL